MWGRNRLKAVKFKYLTCISLHLMTKRGQVLYKHRNSANKAISGTPENKTLNKTVNLYKSTKTIWENSSIGSSIMNALTDWWVCKAERAESFLFRSVSNCAKPWCLVRNYRKITHVGSFLSFASEKNTNQERFKTCLLSFSWICSVSGKVGWTK